MLSDPSIAVPPSTQSSRNSGSYPSLSGARVLVTGGASGIGAAFVRRLLKEGARVGFTDIDEGAASRLLAERREATVGALKFIHSDASDPVATSGAVRTFAEEVGGLDVLINNVANDARHDLMSVTPETWRANMAVNLEPPFFASQAAAPFMQAVGSGAIINLSSLNAYLGPAHMPAYAAAKAGIIGLTKSLARALGPWGIRVNAIVPGWVFTDRQQADWASPAAKEAWRAQCALNTDVLAEDVASLAAFLASSDAMSITGQALTIDAGRS